MTTNPKKRVKKTELYAFRIEFTMADAINSAADKLQINRAEFFRRAVLREVERLGLLPK